MTLSENRYPAPSETGTPKKYTANKTTVYRFEPNSELYEGLRYIWINITAMDTAKPWHINGLRRVNQAVPTNFRISKQKKQQKYITHITHQSSMFLAAFQVPPAKTTFWLLGGSH